MSSKESKKIRLSVYYTVVSHPKNWRHNYWSKSYWEKKAICLVECMAQIHRRLLIDSLFNVDNKSAKYQKVAFGKIFDEPISFTNPFILFSMPVFPLFIYSVTLLAVWFVGGGIAFSELRQIPQIRQYIIFSMISFRQRTHCILFRILLQETSVKHQRKKEFAHPAQLVVLEN